MGELEIDRSCRKGDRGRQVSIVQEWLGLEGQQVVIDGSFGPATEFAVRRFQEQSGVRRDGIVGKRTFAALIRPMTEALESISAGGKGLGELVCLYARRHLKSRPREIGGQNMGPWVRLYMDGRQGAQWPWCAGFVCFILRQACATLGIDPPLIPSVSCDTLAAGARERGLFLPSAPDLDANRLPPGSLFLNRRTGSDWTHTGIILSWRPGVLETIEGNTNDDGSREGYEVCHRWRGMQNKDFVVLRKV